MNKNINDPQRKPDDEARVSFLQTVVSVLASFFGVQSSKNRERDFRRGNPLAFIVVGVGMTALFVLTMWLIVKLVLRLAAA